MVTTFDGAELESQRSNAYAEDQNFAGLTSSNVDATGGITTPYLSATRSQSSPTSKKLLERMKSVVAQNKQKYYRISAAPSPSSERASIVEHENEDAAGISSADTHSGGSIFAPSSVSSRSLSTVSRSRVGPNMYRAQNEENARSEDREDYADGPADVHANEPWARTSFDDFVYETIYEETSTYDDGEVLNQKTPPPPFPYMNATLDHPQHESDFGPSLPVHHPPHSSPLPLPSLAKDPAPRSFHGEVSSSVRSLERTDRRTSPTQGISSADLKNRRSIRFITFLAILLAFFLIAATAGQVLPNAQEITSKLHSSASLSSPWLLSSYLLSIGSFMLPVTRLQTFLPRRFIFSIGAALICLGSVLAGVSGHVAAVGDGFGFLCFCRGVQGLGASAVLTAGHSIFRNSRPSRMMSLLLWVIPVAVGVPVGAVMATIFAENQLSWPWMFFCLASWSATVLVASLFMQDGNVSEVRGSIEKGRILMLPAWERCDAAGSSLLIPGLLLFGTGWGELGSASVGSPVPYVLIAIGLLLLLGFGFIETLVTHPLLAPAKGSAAEQMVKVGHAAVMCAAATIWLWYFAQWTVEVLSDGGLYLCAGLLAVQGVCIVFTSCSLFLLRSRLSAATSLWIRLVGSVLFLIGDLALVTSGDRHPWVGVGFGMVLVPIGFTMAMTLEAEVNKKEMIFDDLEQDNSTHKGYLIGSMTLVFASIWFSIAALVQASIDRRQAHSKGNSFVEEYSGALYVSIALALLGILLGLALIARSFLRTLS